MVRSTIPLMEPTYPILISPQSEEPLASQVHRQLTWLISSSQYKPGDRLPSIRQLSRQLGIHMLTVRSAYLRLERDGLVQTRQGAGTYVLPINPGALMDLAGRSRSYTVGVILPGMSSLFYHDFLEGVEQGISHENLLLIVCNAHEDPQEFLRDFTQLSARNVDGIIVASFDMHPILGTKSTKGLPLVTVDWPDSSGPVVNFDLEDAAWQVVHHLLNHSYQRIGMITFSEESANVVQMQAGYFRALQESGIAVDPALVVRVPGWDIKNGEVGARMLLDSENPPRAIFTVADAMALGVIKYLRSKGKRVPQDLAIASLDDISLASLVEPGLTTVSLPARELGLVAINMLIRLIAGERLEAESITLPTKLVIRASCGCPV